MWGDNYLYLGVSHYCVQVRYFANGHEVHTDFYWGEPWAEGETFPLRFDPANPECNDRSGIWLFRSLLLWAAVALLILILRRVQ